MIKLNNEQVNVTVFPDNTDQVWKLSDNQIKFIINNDQIKVDWIYESPNEIFQLCQLSSLITQEYFIQNQDYLSKLTINAPYLPYARQDKSISNESTFSLHTLISVLGEWYDEIVSFDVHPSNYKEFGLITNVCPSNKIQQAIQHSDTNLLCFPDKGAKLRYGHLFNLPSCFMNKVRDQQTGDIIGLEFAESPPILTDQNILIVDDLLDFGRTFIETSKILNQFNPKSVNLYVSHGLFNGGSDIIYKSGIKSIYTKDGLLK